MTESTTSGPSVPSVVAPGFDFDAFFAPQSVAIVGGSADSRKLGHVLVANMRETGRERVYPVSRSSDEILGYRTIGSLADVPEEPDLVLISVPAASVSDVVRTAGDVGAKAAVVLTAGFGESGSGGRKLADGLSQVIRESGVRVIGPNCMGVCELHTRFAATYYRQSDLPAAAGSIAFISQSGAFGTMAFKRLAQLGAGISSFASIGNMSDVTHSELIRYFADDDRTRAIAAFIEGIPDGPELFDAVAEASARKPVVIFKAGRTKTGEAVSASHTGSLAGGGRLWDALLSEAGAVVVEDSEDLFDSATVLALNEGRRPRRRRFAMVTISGGPAVVAADACETYGLELPDLDEPLQPLRELVPDFASLRNPVDVTAQIDPEDYERVVREVDATGEVDAILAMNLGLDLPQFAEAFVSVWRASRTPMVGYVMGEGIESILAGAGIPNLPSAERAVRAIRRLHDSTSAPLVAAGPADEYDLAPTSLSPGLLTEHASKAMLGAYGFRVTREDVVTSLTEARSAAASLGYPVALKLSSSDVPHKTEARAVHLGLADQGQLDAAFDDLHGRFPGADVLVQEMITGDVELIVGGRRHPQAGAVVMLGLGGVMAEAFDDVTFSRVPVRSGAAHAAIDRLSGQALLGPYRGRDPIDRNVLADLLMRVSAVLAANPGISEIDLNPVLATGERQIVVDALVHVEAVR